MIRTGRKAANTRMVYVGDVLYAPYCRECNEEIEWADRHAPIVCPVCNWLFHANDCYLNHDKTIDVPRDYVDIKCEYIRYPAPYQSEIL